MSQPTISEHIKILEKTLGCKLFDRLGRTISPTRKAEILYPKALDILEDIDKLEKDLASEDQSVTGELIIGASSIPGVYVLPPIATTFKNNHPEISFEIRIADSGKITNSVLSHDLLIGIVGAKISSKDLSFFPFVEDELVLAVGEKRKIGNSVSLNKLTKLPFLMRENGSGTKKSMEEFGIKNGIKLDQLNTVAVLGSNAAIKEAIKSNLGVSILSRKSITDELESGKIKEVKLKGITMKRMFYIVTPRKRTFPNHYSVFLNKLREIKNDIGDGR